MTDSDYRQLMKRWNKTMDWWVKLLHLGEWFIKLEFCREPFECSTEDGWRVAARTVTSWRYADATITVDAPMCGSKSEADLEEIIVHELMHIKLDVCEEQHDDGVYTGVASGATERLCTEIARSLIRARYAQS